VPHTLDNQKNEDVLLSYGPTHLPLAVLVTVESTSVAFDAGLAIGLPTDGTRLALFQPPLSIIIFAVAKSILEGLGR